MISDSLRQQFEQYDDDVDKLAFVESIRAFLHEVSLNRDQPVDLVRWIPIERIRSNQYNPNSVAATEMRLLYVSIDHDGYTQPIVAYWDQDENTFEIVDGFHRYFVMKSNPDIYERCHGLLPIVVIDKDINDRMASTIRHNRARGKHSVTGMSSMVFEMLDNGWVDEDICNELGMEPEELIRLKHITGFSALFKNTEYNRSWMTKNQILLRKKYGETERG